MSLSAAELRRQRILNNSQKRLELLTGLLKKFNILAIRN